MNSFAALVEGAFVRAGTELHSEQSRIPAWFCPQWWGCTQAQQPRCQALLVSLISSQPHCPSGSARVMATTDLIFQLLLLSDAY